jgi:hypothetical protein
MQSVRMGLAVSFPSRIAHPDMPIEVLDKKNGTYIIGLIAERTLCPADTGSLPGRGIKAGAP